MSTLKIEAEGIPEGVNASLLISVQPETAEEFNRMAEAAESAGAEFRVQYGGGGVIAKVAGGRLFLNAPPMTRDPAPNPFIAEFLAERGQS